MNNCGCSSESSAQQICWQTIRYRLSLLKCCFLLLTAIAAWNAIFTLVPAFGGILEVSNRDAYLSYEIWYPFSSNRVSNLRLIGAFPRLPDNLIHTIDDGEAPGGINPCSAVRIKGIFLPPKSCEYTFSTSSDIASTSVDLWFGVDYLGSDLTRIALKHSKEDDLFLARKSTSEIEKSRNSVTLTKQKGYAFQLFLLHNSSSFKMPDLYFICDQKQKHELLNTQFLKMTNENSLLAQFSPPPNFDLLKTRHRNIIISHITKKDAIGTDNALIPPCNAFVSSDVFVETDSIPEITSSMDEIQEMFHNSTVKLRWHQLHDEFDEIKKLVAHYIKTKLPWRYKLQTPIELEKIAESQLGPFYLLEAKLDVDDTDYSQLLSLHIIQNSTNPMSICSHEKLQWSQDTRINFIILKNTLLDAEYVETVIKSIQQFSNLFEYTVDIHFKIFLSELLLPQTKSLITDVIKLSALLDYQIPTEMPLPVLYNASRYQDAEQQIEVLMIPGCELPLDLNSVIRKHTLKGLTCLVGHALLWQTDVEKCRNRFSWSSAPTFIAYYATDLADAGPLSKEILVFSDVVKALKRNGVQCVRKNIPHLYCSV